MSELFSHKNSNEQKERTETPYFVLLELILNVRKKICFKLYFVTRIHKNKSFAIHLFKVCHLFILQIRFIIYICSKLLSLEKLKKTHNFCAFHLSNTFQFRHLIA